MSRRRERGHHREVLGDARGFLRREKIFARGRRRAVRDGLRLVIVQLMVRSNHRLAEPRRRERGHVWRDAPHARRRESIATGEKRREIFAEQRGEHVESSIDEVHGGSPLARLEVQRGALADETRHVRDVHAHLPPGAVGQRRDGHGVVHVHASGGIDGHRSRAAHVASTRHLIGGDGPPVTLGGKIRQRRGSERRVGNVETRQERRRLRVGVTGGTQDAKHARVRMSTRRAPPVDANQKTLADVFPRATRAQSKFRRAAIGRNRQDAPERRASRRVGRKLRRVRLGDDRDVIRATRAKDADHLPRRHEPSFGGGAMRGFGGGASVFRRALFSRAVLFRALFLVLVVCVVVVRFVVVRFVVVRFVVDDGTTPRLDPSRRG